MSSGYYESALLRLRRVTAHLNLRYTDVVKGQNLTPVQFEILLYVGDHGPCTVSEIAEFMVVDRSTSSRVLRGIQTRELIQILRDPGDRRKRKVSLTTQGESMVTSAKIAWLKVEKDIRTHYETALSDLESV